MPRKPRHEAADEGNCTRLEGTEAERARGELLFASEGPDLWAAAATGRRECPRGRRLVLLGYDSESGGKELPFDSRSYRVIFYDDSIGGKPLVERTLREQLHAILQEI
jgi:hypothetical protein